MADYLKDFKTGYSDQAQGRLPAPGSEKSPGYGDGYESAGKKS